MNLHDNADHSYLFVNGKEIFKLKPTVQILSLEHNFLLEVYLMDLMLLNLQNLFVNDEPCMVKPTFIDMNHVELKFHS